MCVFHAIELRLNMGKMQEKKFLDKIIDLELVKTL